MKYNVILFDLDGTLTDSGPGIMNAAAYAMERLGLPQSGRGHSHGAARGGARRRGLLCRLAVSGR